MGQLNTIVSVRLSVLNGRLVCYNNHHYTRLKAPTPFSWWSKVKTSLVKFY